MLSMVLITIIASAHTITKIHWCGGQYTLKAQSIPNGLATVKVYSTNSYSGTPLQTFTINVSSDPTFFNVNQPLRTTKVYVKITWSDNYVNKVESGTNACSTLPIVFGNIKASVNKNFINIEFKLLDSEPIRDAFITLRDYKNEATRIDFIFPTLPLAGDTWLLTVNKLNNSYIIVKK